MTALHQDDDHGEIPDDVYRLLMPEKGRTYTEIEITPALARRLLTFNTHNRNLNIKRIHGYARQMRDGKWRCNGEGIKFGIDENGDIVLLDGQNRLHAIIESGVTVVMLVVGGLVKKDQESMDGAGPRNFSQALKLRGEANHQTMAAVVRAVYLWDLAPKPANRRVGGQGQDNVAITTVTQLMAYFETRPDEFRTLAEVVERLRRPVRVSATIIGPLKREFDRINFEDSKDFWYRLSNKMSSPGDLGPNDPLLQLNKALKRLNEQKKSMPVATEIAALIVKAWNAYRAGEPIRQLSWRSGGHHPEPFPEAR